MIKQIVILISAVLTLTCCNHETARVPDKIGNSKSTGGKKVFHWKLFQNVTMAIWWKHCMLSWLKKPLY